MRIGESITNVSKKPYLPIVVTIDNASANSNVKHGITIYKTNHFGMVQGYSGGGNLYETAYELAYRFSNIDPDPMDGLWHFGMAAQNKAQTAFGTGSSSSNGSLKAINHC